MKKYLIIGGTSGIGKEIVNILSSEENELFITGRSTKEFNNSEKIKYFDIDILDELMELPVINGALNGIVYCPGSITLKPIHLLKRTDFLDEFNLNVLGAVKVIQNYLKNLKESGSASIVLFSTVAVQTGMAYHASIATSKGAVEGLTRSLAAELAPVIRVNAVAPSLTETKMSERLLNTEAKLKSAVDRHPLKRFGSPKDIAQGVVFLLSEESSWITGQILKIDGGLSAIR